MPKYTVIKPGFHGGKSYSPTGKRKTLTVDTAFKKTPEWLKPVKDVSEAVIPDSTPDVSVADIKAELDSFNVKYKGNAKRETLEKMLADARDDQNKRDVEAATSFIESPSLSGPAVTTL